MLAVGVVAVVVLGATVGYQQLRSSSLFAVHDVVVSGAGPGLTPQVEAAAEHAIGGRSLLALDSAAVVRALEQLPTVHDAHVDRDFPSTLRVTVVPERAVAIAVSGHDRALVSADGRVISLIGRRAKPPAGYPHVGLTRRGVPAAGSHLRDPAVLDELAALPAEIGSAVAWVKRDPVHGPFLVLGWPHLPIYLGDTDSLSQKLTAARNVLRKYPTVSDRQGLKYIDVSNPEAPAVMTVTPNATTLALAQPAAGTTDASTGTDQASSADTTSSTDTSTSSDSTATTTTATTDTTSSTGDSTGSTRPGVESCEPHAWVDGEHACLTRPIRSPMLVCTPLPANSAFRATAVKGAMFFSG